MWSTQGHVAENDERTLLTSVPVTLQSDKKDLVVCEPAKKMFVRNPASGKLILKRRREDGDGKT